MYLLEDVPLGHCPISLKIGENRPNFREFQNFDQNGTFEFFKRVLGHFGCIIEPLDPGLTFLTQIFIHFRGFSTRFVPILTFFKHIHFPCPDAFYILKLAPGKLAESIDGTCIY